MSDKMDDVRKRRAYRKKKARLRHLKIGFTVFIISSLLIGATLSLTVLFPIKNVIAVGSNIYSSSDIISASSVKGENIFTISEEKTLLNMQKKLPYIDSLTIERELPDTVKIKVKDAGEYLSYKQDEGFYAVSKKGIVLNVYPETPSGVIEIRTKNVKLAVGKKIEYKKEKTKEITEQLIDELAKRELEITYLDITDVNNITAGIGDRFTVLLGNSLNVDKKCAHLKAMIENIDPNESGTINLSMWTQAKSEGTFVKNTDK